MARALWIPDYLRKYGLEPVLVDGWDKRGSDVFTPRGSVDHHTAGPRIGYLPSLKTLINGRPDLKGPLCHVAEPRYDNSSDNRVWVIASGKANHAGVGGWRNLEGNSSVLGLEREHTGRTDEPTTAHQIDVAIRVHAAFADGAQFAPDYTCEHYEWTPRKIDYINENGGVLRRGAEAFIHEAVILTTPAVLRPATHLPVLKRGMGLAPSPPNDYVKVAQWVLKNKAHQQIAVDGRFGLLTEIAVKNVQHFFSLAADGVIGPKTWDVISFLNY